MKVILEVAQCVDVLDIASRFVAKNATLPILQNIYLKTGTDSLTIRATDMEKYIECEIPCKVQSEGAITVNAKTLLDIVKTIEESNMTITVDMNTSMIHLTTAKDNFEIHGIPASEYVALPDVPQDNTLQLETEVFCKGIDKVEYAITEKNFSPVLTGLLMKLQNKETSNELVFVGTDSFRLAEFKIPTNKSTKEFSVIIPKITINDIKKIAEYAKEKNAEEIQVLYSENLISFSCTIGNTKLLATSLLIQGNFPDYDKEDIMPKNFNSTIIVDKSLCEKAIKKIGILTKDINNFIQIQTTKDAITISSGKTDKGAGTTSIPAITEGETITFGVNGRYVTDFIRMIQGDQIIFHLVDNQKPMILMDKTETNYKYVVRPLISN